MRDAKLIGIAGVCLLTFGSSRMLAQGGAAGGADWDDQIYQTLFVEPAMVAVSVIPVEEPKNTCTWQMVVDDWPDPWNTWAGPGISIPPGFEGTAALSGWDMRLVSSFGQVFASALSADTQPGASAGAESRTSDGWVQFKRSDASKCGSEFTAWLKPKFTINTGVHDDASLATERVVVDVSSILTVADLDVAAALSGKITQTDSGSESFMTKISASGFSVSIPFPSQDTAISEKAFVHPVQIGGPEALTQVELITQEVLSVSIHADGWSNWAIPVWDTSKVSGFAHSSFAGAELISVCLPGDDMAGDECVAVSIVTVSWY